MPNKDEEHDHIVIPLPANFAVLVRQALTLWEQQIRSHAIIQDRQVPTPAAAYRNAEAMLFDQLVMTSTSRGDPEAIAYATRAVQQRRTLFAPPEP
jgi:hypothetical protein